MTEKIFKDIATENLSLPRYYYVYFVFVKHETRSESDIKNCRNSRSCLVVRRKKNTREVYEIVSDADSWEDANAQNIEKLNCEIVKLTDDEARIFSLESKLHSRKLNIIQAIICRGELLRLKKDWAVENLLAVVSKNASGSSYRRANECVRWFIGEIRHRQIIEPDKLTEIELIAGVLEALEQEKIIKREHRQIVTDFRKIYLANDPKMKINTFRKIYYLPSELGEKNRERYPAEEGKKGRQTQMFFATLNDLSRNLKRMIELSGSADFLEKAVIFLTRNQEMIEPVEMLFKNLQKIIIKLDEYNASSEPSLPFEEYDKY